METTENISSTAAMSIDVQATYRELGPLLDANTPTSLDPINHVTLTVFRRVSLGVRLSFSSLGVFTNLINLHTFIRMRLQDTVAISFFALALSDLFNCLLTLASSVSGILEILEQERDAWFRVKPFVAIAFTECFRRIFSSTTTLITTYLAVQRCLCVFLPFHVRGMFTKAKTYCFLTLVFGFCAVSFSLTAWRHALTEIWIRGFNSSQFVVYIRPNSQPFFFIGDVILGIVSNIACQSIVLIGVILIFVTLKKSMQFREISTAKVTANATTNSNGADGKSSSEENTNTKEMQALTQVGLISFIFVCTNAPYFGYGICRLAIPQFGLYLAYHNSFMLVFNVMIMTEMINASVNLFVYLRYNTKFRQLCVISSKK